MAPPAGRPPPTRDRETASIVSHDIKGEVPMLDVMRARDEAGQGLAEYALILSLIAIVAIAALLFLGGQISGILSSIGAAI
jgi:Flp pilus assembly pilin Flp